MNEEKPKRILQQLNKEMKPLVSSASTLTLCLQRLFEDKPMMTINDVRLQGISTPAGPEGEEDTYGDNLT